MTAICEGSSHQQPVSMPCDPKPFSMCKDLIAALRIRFCAGQLAGSARQHMTGLVKCFWIIAPNLAGDGHVGIHGEQVGAAEQQVVYRRQLPVKPAV